MNKTRQVTLLVRLSELATWIGASDWSSENDYLDLPCDTYRPQETTEEYLISLCRNDPQLDALSRHALNGVKRIHIQAEKSLYLEMARQRRINYLKKSLAELAMVSIDYSGINANGELTRIHGFNGGITEIEEQEEFMKINFVNPEHLFSTILYRQGIFESHELPTDVSASSDELIRLLEIIITELHRNSGLTHSLSEIKRDIYVSPDLLKAYIRESDLEDDFLDEIAISYEERMNSGIIKSLDEDIKNIGILFNDPKIQSKIMFIVEGSYLKKAS